MKLKWTKKLPIKDGYYWYKDDYYDPSIVSVYHNPTDGLLCAESSVLFFRILNTLQTGRWHGPLPQPE